MNTTSQFPPLLQPCTSSPVHTRKLTLDCCTCTYASSHYNISLQTHCPVMDCQHTICPRCILKRSTKVWKCWRCSLATNPVDPVIVGCMRCGAARDVSCPVSWLTHDFAFVWGLDWVYTGWIFLFGDKALRTKYFAMDFDHAYEDTMLQLQRVADGRKELWRQLDYLYNKAEILLAESAQIGTNIIVEGDDYA